MTRPHGGLLLRGMRWRLGASLLTVLTATIAVATAMLGPMYLHTAGDSVLRRTVESAAVQTSGASLIPIGGQPVTQATMRSAARQVAASAPGRYGAPLESVQSGIGIVVPGQPTAQRSQLFARAGICHVLHFIAGGCARAPRAVDVSVRTARQLHLHVGDDAVVALTGRTRPARYPIVGIYAIPDESLAYWWGDGGPDFPFGASVPNGTPSTDPLITTAATALAVPAKVVSTVSEQLPLRRGAVTLADEAAVRSALLRSTARLKSEHVGLGTRLPVLLDEADHQRHVMTTIVAVAATQLVLLAIWVLAAQLVRSGDARRSEARVARLRGFAPRSMLWVTAAEPGFLCLAGAIVGVAIALLVVRLARTRLFVPGSAIVVDGWTLAALGLTLLAIVGALGVGTVRLLRSADLAAGPTRTPGEASTWSLVTDAVLVVLAIVALVALSTTGALSGHTDPLASAAPGLIALGGAVLAVHVILFACRLGVRASAGSRRVAPFLALRQTVRRPGVLRQARVLIIALCLACFATVAWSVARRNRQTAASFQIGAHEVVSVTGTAPGSLQAAVDRADPHGSWAMAAVQVQTPSTTLLAVDPSRLAAVASWPDGVSSGGARRVARTLAPPRSEPVSLPGDTLRVSAATGASGELARRLRDVTLAAWIFSPGSGTGLVTLGPLRAGRATYTGTLAGVCSADCRLTGLGLVPRPGHVPSGGGSVRVAVTAIDAGGQALGGDLTAGGWRADATGVQVAVDHATGLVFTAGTTAIADLAGATGSGTSPMTTPADAPAVLPAVATSELAALNAGALGPLTAEGFDGNTIHFHPQITATALPRVGGNAALVDLGFLSAAQTGPTHPGTVDQVWLSDRAPRDAMTRLRAAGLDPVAVARAATVFSALQHTGPALADDFLLFATIAALLVAAASTLGALGATTRERATELTSLEVAGVPRPTLVRALGLETGILLLTALCGAGAGALAAVLAVPSLPELAASTLAPLHYALPGLVFALVTVSVIAVVALAAATIATVLLRRMSPGMLRTAPDDVSG